MKNILWVNMTIVIIVLITGLSCYYLTNKKETTKEIQIEGIIDKIEGRYITVKDETKAKALSFVEQLKAEIDKIVENL